MINTFPYTTTLYSIDIKRFFTCAEIHNICITRVLADTCDGEVAKKIGYWRPDGAGCGGDISGFPNSPIHTTGPDGSGTCKINPDCPHASACYCISGGLRAPCITITGSDHVGIRSPLGPAQCIDAVWIGTILSRDPQLFVGADQAVQWNISKGNVFCDLKLHFL